MTFEELPALRKKTEAISKFLQDRLSSYLETLKPLFSPERYFGKFAGGKTDILGSDKAVAQISQAYKDLGGKPFDLPREFESEWLAACGSRIDLHRHEYIHQATGADGNKPIRITAPMRWIMTCGSALSPFQAVQVATGQERSTTDTLRQFTVNALVMQLVIARNPGLVELFTDLRFQLHTEVFPETGKLPFVTVSSSLPSIRPSDDLILAATEFSGVQAFIE